VALAQGRHQPAGVPLGNVELEDDEVDLLFGHSGDELGGGGDDGDHGEVGLTAEDQRQGRPGRPAR
jgi:hypothetical protein